MCVCVVYVYLSVENKMKTKALAAGVGGMFRLLILMHACGLRCGSPAKNEK